MQHDKELDITIYEDLEHLSNLWRTSDTKNADVRNSVHILRRLLIYGDLQKSASSRTYQLLIDAPDLKPFVKATKYNLIEFYQAGGANVFGMYIAGAMLSKGTSHRLNRIMKEYNPEIKIKLNITSYLRQQCFSLKGEFVSREDVIKYVANKAGSTHFDRKGRDALIDRIRGASVYKLTEDGIPSLSFNLNSFANSNSDFDPNPKHIDPIFLEVAASAKYITESQSIVDYRELLKQEYGL